MRELLIGIITGEYGRRADFHDYLHHLKKPPDTLVYACHGASPAYGRNLIVGEARRYGCRSILFLDDDIVCYPDTLERLLAHDVEVVSGLYCGRSYPHYPLVFSHFDDHGAVLSSFVNTAPGLRPIAAAGMGCCLIKTEVFDRLEAPYFRLGELDPEQWCDDIGFFKRLEAAGVKSFCDTRLEVGHIGSVVVWPDYTATGWAIRYDTTTGYSRREVALAPMAAQVA